jgi:predicted unusual protein kinase regulating ubiquinone biosynthesis (AarF/ABC1/UbiB family)
MAAKQMDGDFDFEESVELLEDLGYSDSTRPFTISNDLIYLAKSYTLVEGICKTLDPDYMPIETLRPYVESKITSSDISSNINFEGAMADILEIPAKVRNINASILTIEKSTYSMTAKTKNLKEDVRNLQIIVGMFMFYILQH